MPERPIPLAGRFADPWSYEARTPSRRRAPGPVTGDVDVLLLGLTLDRELDVVEDELDARGIRSVRVDVDCELFGGLRIELRPPQVLLRPRAVLCRNVDAIAPIADHRTSTFVSVGPTASDRWSDHAQREARAALDDLVALVDSERWVNDPHVAERADGTAIQLRAAAGRGLPVPRSLITADVDAVRAFARSCDGGLVTKALADPFVWRDGRHAGFLHTTLLTEDAVASLDSSVRHPGLFQERLHSVAEYRVTVVGDHGFTARTQMVATDVDWRRRIEDGVAFERVELSTDVHDAVVGVVSDLGLSYAGVDLVETADGTIWFLEVNPSGAYWWLEAQLGMPITAAIVDLLCGEPSP